MDDHFMLNLLHTSFAIQSYDIRSVCVSCTKINIELFTLQSISFYLYIDTRIYNICI